MSSRAWLAVVVTAVVFGAIGYYYGTREQLGDEPYASPATVVAGPAERAPICRASATVTYDPAASPPLTIQAGPDKAIPIGYPSVNPSSWGVCFTLVVHGDDDWPFRNLKVDLERNLGAKGRPIFTGDPSFRGNQEVRLRFDDEPEWSAPNYDSYVVKYFIRGKLKDGTPIEADPDIVIQKPGT